MVQRSECLFNDEVIGIESIYTIVDGKQINIPEKIESLRKKGREGLLKCTCGCGTKLILVAGDKNLREQHFRAIDENGNKKCTFKQEGPKSIDSKIVLKCWLSEKIKSEIETRVPINKIINNDKKYELSHLARSNKIALNYTNTRLNLDDVKFQEIDELVNKFKIYHIVDFNNIETNGQYPEFMMKIQNRQSYCLFLNIDGRNYTKAKLISSYYTKNIYGTYISIQITEGYISEYSFNSDGNLLFKDNLISDLFTFKKNEYDRTLMEEKKKYEEEIKKQKDIQERNRIEYSLEKENYRRFEYERNKTNRQKLIEAIKKSEQFENEAKLQKEKEAKQLEELKDKCEEKAKKEIDTYTQSKYVDVLEREWYKCEKCGKVKLVKEFACYGGANKASIGICFDCIKNKTNNIEFEIKDDKQKANSDFCPLCGSKLVKRRGKYGEFIGCSSYPLCKYSRSL